MMISQWMYNGFAVPFLSDKLISETPWGISIGFCDFFHFFLPKFIETYLNVPMYPSFSADAIPIFKDFPKSYHPWRFAGSTIGHRQAPERQVRQVPFHWGMFQTRPSQWWEGRGIISTNDQSIWININDERLVNDYSISQSNGYVTKLKSSRVELISGLVYGLCVWVNMSALDHRLKCLRLALNIKHQIIGVPILNHSHMLHFCHPTPLSSWPPEELWL